MAGGQTEQKMKWHYCTVLGRDRYREVIIWRFTAWYKGTAGLYFTGEI